MFEVIRGLRPSSRGELEITDVNRHYAERGALACHRVSGWWEDAGTQESLPEIGALIARTGVNKVRVIEGLLRIPLRLFEDERGWFAEIRRESLLPKPTRQTNVSFSRQGVIRGLHYHERGQDDLFVCLQGTGARRRARPRHRARASPRTSATTTRPRSTFRGTTRTASRRSPISSSATT